MCTFQLVDKLKAKVLLVQSYLWWMLCGHNAVEGEETTLAFIRIAGAGANQREFATAETDATVKQLNILS